MSTYKFVLVTEAVEENDYISPEWSHAILAGAVPVYIGAPNIAAFAPGPRSYIDIRDFSSAEELWKFLVRLGDNTEQYKQYFEWKKGANAAYKEDEGDANYGLGTGDGVRVDNIHLERLTERVKQLSLPSVGNENNNNKKKDGAHEKGGAVEFNQTAMDAWRLFRSHLDHCVHYAECRLCQMVTKLT